MPMCNISNLLNLKFPLQNRYNRRVCYIIGSPDSFSQAVLFCLLLFNPIVNEKATDNHAYYIIVQCNFCIFVFKFNLDGVTNCL